MDCKTARLLLDFARPLHPELEESEGEALAGHLADCAACAALHRVERRIDDHLGKAMRDVPVPDGLRERLLGKLAKQGERRYLRRLAWGAAAAVAASVLFVAGLTYFGQRPAVDLNQLHADSNELPGNGSDVEEFLKKRFQRPGLLAPTQFDYRGLIKCDWAYFQGKKVPCLVFRQGNDLAWVYIVNDRQFDLNALEAQGPLSGNLSAAVLWPSGGQKHTAYIVIFTGGLLETFFTRTPPA
jgi:hypothetical protein